MWAALPTIISLIARVLTLLGVTIFSWSLIKTGAVDQAAKGVGNVTEGVGETVKAGGGVAQGVSKVAGAGEGIGSFAVLGIILMGIVLIRR